MKIPTDDQETKPSVPQDYRNNSTCWRSLCEDLIYRGAFGGGCYASHLDKFKQLSAGEYDAAIAAGDAIRDQLAADYPNETSRLRRSQLAWAKADETLQRYAKWLPKRPGIEGAKT